MINRTELDANERASEREKWRCINMISTWDVFLFIRKEKHVLTTITCSFSFNVSYFFLPFQCIQKYNESFRQSDRVVRLLDEEKKKLNRLRFAQSNIELFISFQWYWFPVFCQVVKNKTSSANKRRRAMRNRAREKETPSSLRTRRSEHIISTNLLKNANGWS